MLLLGTRGTEPGLGHADATKVATPITSRSRSLVAVWAMAGKPA